MKLFLSYAAENCGIAEEIYFALVGAGHEVFFDRPSLKPGDNYDRRLREAIEAADGVIFLISPQSVQIGGYALTELKYARQKWVHPERRVLPVMVKPTRFEAIPAYLRAVTILQPEGNIAAEVTEALKGWGKPTSIATRRQEIFPQAGDLLTILLSSIFVAAGLGTLFSLVYPRVEIDLSLASLFMLVGVLIVLAVRGVWKTIWRSTR
ncbi:MAG: toll/interleukin-1 receptor domain-containing protein [Nitrososphaera sp.]|nr:toll/interleukin-1 receptor domain-containing protein [Nitrososphaera sp.]